jgi:hypothetical protein
MSSPDVVGAFEARPRWNRPPRSAVLLSLVVVLAAAAAASVATLVWDGSFPDPSPAPLVNRVLAEARGRRS